MLDKIAILLIVLLIILAQFVGRISPEAPRFAGAPQPAALPYDKDDFCAYHSHLVLSPFEEGGARFLFNVLLPDAEQSIDMIMLAKSGIYVFEHPKACGWITGMEDSEEWSQRVRVGYGGKTQDETFSNPVTTVREKTEQLKAFLETDGVLYRSLVVFPDFCFLSNIKVFDPYLRVVLLGQLLPAVVALDGKIGVNLTQREINELFDTLVEHQVIPNEDHEQEFQEKAYE